MTRRRRLVATIAAVPLAAGAMLAGASGASAAPSGNASCVAQFTSEFGPNKGAGGELVSAVARFPRQFCFFFFP